MFGLYLINAVLLTGTLLVVVAGEDTIQLSISPAGVLKKGDTFSITCVVKEFGDFEIVKIIRTVKDPKNQIERVVNLAVNEIVEKEFDETRYKTDVDYAAGRFTLTIENAEGGDGGNLGCEHAGSRNNMDFRETAMEYVTIYVPAETVQIRSKNSDGTWIPVEDDGKVIMREGFNDGFDCYTEVSGSDPDIKPKTVFKIGSVDGTTYSKVEHDSEYTGKLENNHLIRKYKSWYKLETDKADRKFNNYEVECTVTMPEYEPITTIATLFVEYAPDVSCRDTTYAEANQENVKVTCLAEMNPAPTSSYWTWGNGNDTTMLNTGELSNGYSAEQKQIEDNKWEFSLVVSKVDASYFQTYKFSVENGLGEPIVVDAKLAEVEETPEPEPQTTTAAPKSEPKSAEKSDPQMNEVIASEAKGTGTQLCASLLSFALAMIVSLR